MRMDIFKISSLGFCFIIIFLAEMSCGRVTESWDSIHTERITVEVLDTDEKFSFYVYKWGISGNHDEIIFSNREVRNKKTDPDKDFIFSGTSTLYFKVERDTLTIVGRTSPSIPSKFTSNTEIVFQILTNMQMIEFQNSSNLSDFHKINWYTEAAAVAAPFKSDTITHQNQ